MRINGLAAIFPAMLNALIVLKALGHPDDHPQVERAAVGSQNWSMKQPNPCVDRNRALLVWDTAIVVIALHESGTLAIILVLKV